MSVQPEMMSNASSAGGSEVLPAHMSHVDDAGPNVLMFEWRSMGKRTNRVQSPLAEGRRQLRSPQRYLSGPLGGSSSQAMNYPRLICDVLARSHAVCHCVS